MPYFGTLNHLPPLQPGQGSRGPSAAWWENIPAQWDVATRVNSEYALEAELVDMYAENLQRAQEFAGIDIENPIGAGPGGWQFMRDVVGLRLGDTGPIPTQVIENYPWVRDFNALEERLAELNAQNPEIKTFDQLVADVQALRQEIVGNAADVSSRSGIVGQLAGFVGGVAGSFTFRDPSLLVSALIPVGGSNAAMRIIAEAGLGASVEAGIQFGTVVPRAEMLGEDPGNPWLSIAMAGVGAGAFRGVFESGPLVRGAYDTLGRQLFPEQFRARVLASELDMTSRSLPRVINEGLVSPRPVVRAAAHELDGTAALARESPYGATTEGLRMAQQDVVAMLSAWEGFPRGTGTAVNRFMSSPEERLFNFGAETPQAMQARLQEPELYARFDAAQQRLAEAETRVTELEQGLAERTMADAISLVDEASGARVRAIQEELDNPALPAARRTELERERDMIVESLGPDRIARLENDARIQPRYELRDARRAATQARRAFSREARQVAEVEARVLADLCDPGPLSWAQQADELELNVLRPATELAQVARESVASVQAMVRATADEPSAMVSVAGRDIPRDFEFEFDGRRMTVAEALEDLEADDAMVEAMRTCAI